MKTIEARNILQRHPGNPILKPSDFPGVNTVFNPSPIMYQGKTVLLVSCTTYQDPDHGFREMRVAMSDDGVHFTMADKPLVVHGEHPSPIRELGGVIDCRLTRIGDEYYFITPQGAGHMGFSGCCSVLYKTRDFQKAELMDVVALPFNRGSSLFPEKINGYYWRLDRPGEHGDAGSIWISCSPDLLHWGQFRPLLKPGYSIWNTSKIGPTPPVRVKEGWLVIVHGVDTTCNVPHYYIGAILLDAADPRKVIGKTQGYLLAPEMPYETTGQVGNVVFPCGCLVDETKDEIRLYYGAADTCIGLATGSLKQVVRACIEGL